MLRSLKSTILGIALILIISFILPGCYTQLSRPRVDTEDEYYEKSEYGEVEEYYQDQGTPTEDKQNINIYNYYPYWNGYYDYWYWDYPPFYWRYVGPYPHHWWDPYGHWWMPGWYLGFSYHNYWWSGYPYYHDPYYGYGYNYRHSTKLYGKRPFTRRSPRLVDRDQRNIDAQTSLAKPQIPKRMERPQTTLSTPQIRDKSLSPDRQRRSIREIVTRAKPRTVTPTIKDDARRITRPRSTARKSEVMKNVPRSSRSNSQPKMIETAQPKSRENASKKSYSSPGRSHRSYNPPSSSSSPRVSRPATPSYTPSSSSSSGTRSTSPSRSSSSRSSSSSKSSGSSKTSRK